jgi:predicted transcriptional regulator
MLSSVAKCELLALFHRDPDLRDSVEGLAAQIGLASEEITHDVDDLIELGLLRRERTMGVELISWDRVKGEEIEDELSKALLTAKDEGIVKVD